MRNTWEADTTHRVGRQLRKSRKEMKLTAQRLADRTAELGHPIGPATITDLETGRRQSVTVADLLILAAALDISPVALLYADQFADGEVEMLPGVSATAAQAAMWCTGETAPYGSDDDVGKAQTALAAVRERHSNLALAERWVSTGSRLPKENLTRWAETAQIIEERYQELNDELRELGLIVTEGDEAGSDAGVD